ncbi:MAG: hypothetical protein ACFFDD_15445 [Promethearchaeota archaeon]
MNDTDDSWLKLDKPSYESFYIMLFATVITVVIILYFTGAPIRDPISFLTILVFVCGIGLICSLLNREVSRSLGFKDPGHDIPI